MAPADPDLKQQKETLEIWKKVNSNKGSAQKEEPKVLPSVRDSIDWIAGEAKKRGEKVDLLITGSLHLAGATLTAVDYQVE